MQSGPESDRALAERLIKGDDISFNQLLERYKRPVLNFIYRLLGDATEAEDAAQNVFVSVYRNVGRFRFRSRQESCAPWIFQIARNEVIDRIRRRTRHPEEPLDESGVMDAATASGATADKEAEANEISALIASAVADLPEDQRAAFILAEYNDLSYAEIAETMECSIKSVESRLYRAKHFLRARLRGLIE
jgi:RNA polymerase sigma-70 factor (ECF subfamily)